MSPGSADRQPGRVLKGEKPADLPVQQTRSHRGRSWKRRCKCAQTENCRTRLSRVKAVMLRSEECGDAL